MFLLSVRVCWLISLTALLGACAQPHLPSAIGAGRGEGTAARTPLASIAEPESREVVVVINANTFAGAHAGMFVGTRLYDPSGTYVGAKSEDRSWSHPTLGDYLGYQLRDGPDVRVYRFDLAETDFDIILSRIEHAGWTMPMFCAASLQSVLAGVGPFKHLESSWWTSPRQLGALLDATNPSTVVSGLCDGLNAQPC